MVLKALSVVSSVISVLLLVTAAGTLAMRDSLAQLGLGLLFTVVFVGVPVAIASLGSIAYCLARKQKLIRHIGEKQYSRILVLNGFAAASVFLFAGFYESVRRF